METVHAVRKLLQTENSGSGEGRAATLLILTEWGADKKSLGATALMRISMDRVRENAF